MYCAASSRSHPAQASRPPIHPPAPPCSLPFAKTPRGRLAVNDRLQVLMPPKLNEESGHVWADGEKGPGPTQLKDVSDECEGSACSVRGGMRRSSAAPPAASTGPAHRSPLPPLWRSLFRSTCGKTSRTWTSTRTGPRWAACMRSATAAPTRTGRCRRWRRWRSSRASISQRCSTRRPRRLWSRRRRSPSSTATWAAWPASVRAEGSLRGTVAAAVPSLRLPTHSAAAVVTAR